MSKRKANEGHLEQRWVPVADASGRVHMEARWVVVTTKAESSRHHAA
jgi:hypothetical protein